MKDTVTSSIYDLEEHRHRFSIWAAARASQRKWKSASVEILGQSLEACGVVECIKVRAMDAFDESAFRSMHREWCRSAISYLTAKGVADATFGRVAKLIAVYLKSMVILGPYPEANLAQVAHPPIDRILLHNLAACESIHSLNKPAWKTVNWTQLTEEEYYALVDQLRTVLTPSEPFWALEQFWTVVTKSRGGRRPA